MVRKRELGLCLASFVIGSTISQWMGIIFFSSHLGFENQIEFMVTSPQQQQVIHPFRPEICSEHERDILKKHLPSDECEKTYGKPWRNTCSFSYATRCPNATWIEDLYQNQISSTNWEKSTFLGISIGCNKGFDALNTMRMGTFDPVFDKETWRKARGDVNVDNRCGSRNDDSQFDLDSTRRVPRPGEMHCVEALPLNYKKLKKAADELGLTNKGFVVSQAAVAEKDGTTLFPSGEGKKDGVENLGIGNCNGSRVGCVEVNESRLDSYVEKYVNSTGNINHLSIDIEGYDVTALQSASKILDRVEYLEFEYNWMGKWGKAKLSDTIEMLNNARFTCYWIGNDELWRITDCFHEYYNKHFWSNVGCAHRTLAPQVLNNMEDLFQQTLTQITSTLSYVTAEYDRHYDIQYMKRLRQMEE